MFGYVRGQFLFSLIMGTSAGICLYILGSLGIFPEGKTYAFAFGAFYGFAELIPYIGPAVGAFPPVMIALFSGEPLDALWLAIMFTALQQIEGHIVAPNVFGHALRINPLLVIFALLLGGQIYGFIGAFIALPIAAILRETVVYLRRHLDARAVAARARRRARRGRHRGRARARSAAPAWRRARRAARRAGPSWATPTRPRQRRRPGRPRARAVEAGELADLTERPGESAGGARGGRGRRRSRESVPGAVDAEPRAADGAHLQHPCGQSARRARRRAASSIRSSTMSPRGRDRRPPRSRRPSSCERRFEPRRRRVRQRRRLAPGRRPRGASVAIASVSPAEVEVLGGQADAGDEIVAVGPGTHASPVSALARRSSVLGSGRLGVLEEADERRVARHPAEGRPRAADLDEPGLALALERDVELPGGASVMSGSPAATVGSRNARAGRTGPCGGGTAPSAREPAGSLPPLGQRAGLVAQVRGHERARAVEQHDAGVHDRAGEQGERGGRSSRGPRCRRARRSSPRRRSRARTARSRCRRGPRRATWRGRGTTTPAAGRR